MSRDPPPADNLLAGDDARDSEPHSQAMKGDQITRTNGGGPMGKMYRQRWRHHAAVADCDADADAADDDDAHWRGKG